MTLFVLGTLIIVDTLLDVNGSLGELIVGMVMLGVLPLSDIGAWFRRNGSSATATGADKEPPTGP